jgi:hypothetical protein
MSPSRAQFEISRSLELKLALSNVCRHYSPWITIDTFQREARDKQDVQSKDKHDPAYGTYDAGNRSRRLLPRRRPATFRAYLIGAGCDCLTLALEALGARQ